MSFPIFFKMEIKKSWRKSCDFVISNPVSGVSWRDLIVQALHNQRTAQIHINLSVHTPSALSAQTEAPAHSHGGGSGCADPRAEGPHCPAHFVPLIHGTNLWKCRCSKVHKHKTQPGPRWPAQREKTILTFHLWLMWGFLVENFQQWIPGNTVSCRFEKLLWPKNQLNSPTLQDQGRAASPQHSLSVVPKLNLKDPKENAPA